MVDQQESGGAPPDAPHHAPEADKHGLERVVFFSDAVIAIAMTLLALDLEVPTGASDAAMWHSLREHWHNSYFPFLLSFVVIASFWFSHHQFFGKVRQLGGRLVQLNMVFLLMIVLLPFVTRVLGTSGDFTPGPVLYASVLAATCFLMAAMTVSARRHDLLQSQVRDIRDAVWGLSSTGVVFLVSIPIAFANVSLAEWSWLVLSVLAHRAPAWWNRLRAR